MEWDGDSSFASGPSVGRGSSQAGLPRLGVRAEEIGRRRSAQAQSRLARCFCRIGCTHQAPAKRQSPPLHQHPGRNHPFHLGADRRALHERDVPSTNGKSSERKCWIASVLIARCSRNHESSPAMSRLCHNFMQRWLLTAFSITPFPSHLAMST